MAESVLIIEDEQSLVELLRINLTSAGYAVTACGTGEEGIAAAESLPPDIIVLDVRLPGMDGWQVCRAIKAARATRDIPVIFLTAASQKRDLLQAENAGADFYMTKPFDPLEVVARIRALLARKRDKALRAGKKRILIVDDDPNIRELLSVNIAAWGYSVAQESDGNAAIERIAENRPDVLILDVMMPGMDGWEICKTVRDRFPDGRIRIIMLTARDSDRDRLIGTHILKADAYVTKPFDLTELKTVIAELA